MSAFSILYEDAQVVAVDKPAGLAVQGGSGVEESLEALLQRFAKPKRKVRLVHRLDRETSGVLIAAKTQPAAAALSQAFAERRVKKRYLALVCGGAPEPPEGEIALPLQKAPGPIDLVRVARAGEGQAALTRYRTRAAIEGAALLDLAPETGRMHQLRAHLAAIGRPIAGDGKYGGLFTLAGRRVAHLMLHAAALEVPHPETGATLRLEAAPPADFQSLCAALSLSGPAC